jgi:protein-S-isoprenylcysteine O-methyltransferase Ste14
MHEFIARHRTKISQLLGGIFLLVFTFSEKELEKGSVAVITGIMFLVGLFFCAVATVGRLWCAQYIAGYKTDKLVTEGPYSVCRNPLYFFSLLGGTGAGLCTECLTLAAIIPCVFAVIYPITIKNEERTLSRIFGSAYDDYTARVPRFLPKWSLFHEPPEYVVVPKVFRREAIDALYFVLIIGYFEIVEELIELGIIKTFISIY